MKARGVCTSGRTSRGRHHQRLYSQLIGSGRLKRSGASHPREPQGTGACRFALLLFSARKPFQSRRKSIGGVAMTTNTQGYHQLRVPAFKISKKPCGFMTILDLSPPNATGQQLPLLYPRRPAGRAAVGYYVVGHPREIRTAFEVGGNTSLSALRKLFLKKIQACTRGAHPAVAHWARLAGNCCTKRKWCWNISRPCPSNICSPKVCSFSRPELPRHQVFHHQH